MQGALPRGWTSGLSAFSRLAADKMQAEVVASKLLPVHSIRIFDAARFFVDDLEHVVGIGMVIVDISHIAVTLYVARDLVVIERGHGKPAPLSGVELRI